jgi:hypothetical protein
MIITLIIYIWLVFLIGDRAIFVSPWGLETQRTETNRRDPLGLGFRESQKKSSPSTLFERKKPIDNQLKALNPDAS